MNPLFKKSFGPLAAMLLLTTSITVCLAQSPGPAEIDGPALFQKIHQLRVKLQPKNSEENGLLYLLNTPENLHLRLQFFQMMPRNSNTTLHIWALPEDVQAHPELLGTPTTFPQMWVRYNGPDLIEVGASHVAYPAIFQIDAKAYPNFIYDVSTKTVRLP
jgi:hypothetical protein